MPIDGYVLHAQPSVSVGIAMRAGVQVISVLIVVHRRVQLKPVRASAYGLILGHGAACAAKYQGE
jgi:hypothetical protein